MKRFVLSVLMVMISALQVQAQDSQAFGHLLLGSTGCVVSTGTGAPSGGSTCDYYIDASTGIVYHRFSGNWVALTDSVGTLVGNATLSTLTGADTSYGILHNGAVVSPDDATRKVILHYWDKTGASASPDLKWTQTIVSTANISAHDNSVFQMGWNVTGGAALINGSYSGVRDAWEQYYEPSTSGVGYWERHIAANPTDQASHGEIRMISMTGRADVTRDNVHPITSLQSEYWAFGHPSVAGLAYGDSFRITLDGTNFGAAFTFNNSYSYFSRGGRARGATYPFLFQTNAAASASIPVLYFGTSFDGSGFANDNDLHLMFNTFPSATVVHVGTGGAQSRFIVDGRNAADNHALLLFREEQGAGTKESFIGVDASTLYIGVPQSALASYADSSVSAGASLAMTSSAATFTPSVNFSANAGTSTFASQTTGWRIDNAGRADVRYLYTDELRAKLFTADLESVLAGSQRITKSFSTISQTFTCPALGSTSTLWVKDAPTFGDAAVFVSGDSVVIHAMTRTVFGPFTITDCVGVVTSYTDGTGANAGQQSWTFTRNTSTNGGAMTASTTVAVDQLVQDLGTTGNGYVESTAVDGAAGINAPYTQIVTWATAPVSANLTVRARFGNLRGITSTTEHGVIAGTYGATNGAFFRASDQNFDLQGITAKWWDSTNNVVTIAPNSGSPYVAIGNPAPSACCATAGIFLGWDHSASKAKASFYSDANNFLTFDGAKLTWKAANTTLDGSGNLTASSATLSGAITANTGFIGGTGGWVIASGLISATHAKLGSDGTDGYVSFGATPPTTYGNNVGAFLGYSSAAKLSLYADASNFLQWDGSKLVWKAANSALDSSGNFTASSATITGTITAASGTVVMDSGGIHVTVPPTAMTASYGYGFNTAFTGTNFFGTFASENGTARTLFLNNSTTQTATTVRTSVRAENSSSGPTATVDLEAITGGNSTITSTANSVVMQAGSGTPITATFNNTLALASATDGVLSVNFTGAAAANTAIVFLRSGGLQGSITTTGGATAYNTTSDARLKTDIRPTGYGLADLQRIDVRDFAFLADPARTAHTGFIAQQLEPIYPEAVTRPFDAAGYWQVDYGKLTPLLVRSVQELAARVAELEAKLKAQGGGQQ
jgi:hypothetical protein